ncbi:MAG TPA: MATE family efflux transporter [Clostridia bacterium]|nr:MATE family efflux transporter [Clostridia bacterium]
MDKAKQLGEEKVLKLLLKFSIPAIIGMLVNALYNMVDRIFIGHGVGSAGIAGITMGFPIMLVIMAFSMLVGLGANSLISIRLGEQKKDEAELIMGNALALLVILSLTISSLGLFFLKPMLKLFGASEVVFPYAQNYLNIILLGAVFQSIGFGMNNFIRSEGYPKKAMLTMLIGAVLNTILDPIFIFIFGWGVEGAALATIISQAISAAWVLNHFLRGDSLLKLKSETIKIQFPIMLKIFAVGSAPFAMQMAASLLNAILNRGLSTYGGDVAVSGMGIVMSIATLILMPVFGINQGIQPIIGYNYGAKNFDRVKETLKLGILGATIIVCIGFLATRLFPIQLISIFNKEDVELLQFGTQALKTYFIFLPIIGFQIVGANYFQAIGKPKQAMLLSLSRQVLILIPALLILPKFYALQGVLMAGPVADLISSIITGAYLVKEYKALTNKQQKIIKSQPQIS